jgi:deoxyribodipyrimidine photo-lyase
MNKQTTPSILWFRQDLRLADNAALAAAVARGGPVIPVYIWSPAEEGDWEPGRASRWWLDRSLVDLDASLKRAGSRLIVRRGRSEAVLRALMSETGADGIFLNRRYEPAAAGRDVDLTTSLASNGTDVFVFNDSLLFDPTHVLNNSGEPYRVFTPYWNRLLSLDDPGARIPAPATIPAPAQWPESIDVQTLQMVRSGDGTVRLANYWNPGEGGAFEKLDRFLQIAEDQYGSRHDFPGESGTSRLSPYLHFGEISPQRLWYEVRRSGSHRENPARDPYLRQLAWREFSAYLLHHFPESASQPLRKQFESFPWRDDPAGLEAWKTGRTGYPLVDAGIRELHETGWMHNRVRMVAASFLVKHLMIDWREGARWFWDTLVDADLANNTMGWQWTAGSGADAAPYFRIFNPTLQQTRFDPAGAYVNRWLPATGERVEPIVAHNFARSRALEAFSSLGKPARTKPYPRKENKS